MKDITKLIITGLIVLFFVSIPVSLLACLWNAAMHHIPVAETALRAAITVGCIGLGGVWSFVAFAWGCALGVLITTIFDK